MECKFDIDKIVDSAGVAVYIARQDEDFDYRGIPHPGSIRGIGDTKWDAFIDLFTKLRDIENQEG